MNFRTTAILFIVMVAVGLLLLLTRDKDQTTTTDLPTVQKLLTLAPADVTKVAITPADEPKVVLDRADGKWQMTEPVKSAAEESVVASLVSALTGLETRGKIVADASTGFDKPSYKLEISTKSGKPITVDIGKRSGTGGNMYVRLNNASQADVVPDTMYSQLTKPTSDWRRKRMFEASGIEVKQMRIATTQQSITLEKHGVDWKMTQPSEMPVDPAAASNLAMALTNLQAVDYVSETSDNLARYGLEPAQVTASFSTEAPATQPSTSQPAMITVKLGRYDDVLRKNLYASSSTAPGVVRVAASTLDSLKKPPLELRDKRILDIDPEKVTKITLTTDKPATTQPTTREASHASLVLERNRAVVGATTAPATGPATAEAATKPATPPAKWKLASGGNADADDTKVQTILTSLHPLRAEKFLESAPTLQSSTEYTLVIETTDASHTVKILDVGVSQPPVASYNGLTFNVQAFLVRDLEGDFAKPDTAPSPLLAPPSIPGMPFQ